MENKNDDPRKRYIRRLPDAWKQQPFDEEAEDEADDPITAKHHDAATNFSDGVSFAAAIPDIPSGLPTGTTLRLIREQRHTHFGGAL